MMDFLSPQRNKIRTLILLVISGLLAIIAAAIGVSDNPPGILFAYLATITFVLAFVHPWRTLKQFRRLLYASVLGFAFFVLLHNVFEAIAHNDSMAGALQTLLEALAGAAFFIATLLCPAAFLVSAIGLGVLYIGSRRQSM